MKQLLLTVVFGAALVLPIAAVAQNGASAGPHFACRAASTSETPNGTIGGRQVRCNTIDAAHIRTAFETAMQGLSAGQKAKVQTAMQTIMKEFGFIGTYPGAGSPGEY